MLCYVFLLIVAFAADALGLCMASCILITL